MQGEFVTVLYSKCLYLESKDGKIYIYSYKSTLLIYQNYVIKEDHQLILFVYLDIIRGKYIHKKEDVL